MIEVYKVSNLRPNVRVVDMGPVVCVRDVSPQNKWPQLVWTGNVAVCRHTGQLQSLVLMDGQGCVDS